VKVTAAITTFNRADLVVGAVESVLSQAFGDKEVLVVDDGSTDDTRARLEPYANQIRYVWQENRGRAGGRNRAIAEARGEYVAFLDSDDEWLPGKLEREAPILDADPAVGLVHGHIDVVDECGSTLDALTEQHRRLFEETEATYAGWALRCMCLTSTTMMRRSLLESLGGYDEKVEQEDLDLYLRIALESRVAFVCGAPLARYRYHQGQTGHDELTRGQIAVCLKHLDLLRERRFAGARRARRNFCITLARSYHLLADAAGVRRWTAAAVRTDPSAVLMPGVVRRLALSFAPRGILLRARTARAASRGVAWRP
jgi:glycosyltransferase involved in cell wall biosynthesis